MSVDVTAGTAVVRADVPLNFGSPTKWVLIYNAALDVLVLKDADTQSVAFAKTSPDGVAFNAADDADGNEIFARTEAGGTVVGGTTGKIGGDARFSTGKGSAAKAASGAAGGRGGDLIFQVGDGGAGDGAGPAGRPGHIIWQVQGGGAPVIHLNDVVLGPKFAFVGALPAGGNGFGPGSLVILSTDNKLYINIGTEAATNWQVVGAQTA